MSEFKDLNLNGPLYNALEELEYISPTPIQVEAVPAVMSGNDVVGIAQTGTGKTFAYLLPILRQMKFAEQRHPRVLIMVPTRELVLQVVREIEKLTKYITVRFAGVYGGTNINTQKQLVYDGLDILVATPGRLMDLTMTGVLRLKSVQRVVIDEVDEMLALGFRPQIISILEILPERRQNLMFSATLTEDVDELITDFFSEPLKVEIAPHGTPLEKIEQFAYHIPNFFTKVNLLEYLLKNDEDMLKVLVFIGSKKLADRIFEELSKKGVEGMGVIHSNKSQNLRINTLNRFHNSELRVLLATDIVARGLDVSDVSHVINFDMPEDTTDYMHRIGRTGRAKKEGIAISFVNEVEQEYQMAVEQLMSKIITLIDLPEDLTISQIYTDEERPSLFDKHYLKAPGRHKGGDAFHEKSEKNKKRNSGSPGLAHRRAAKRNRKKY